MSKKYYQDGSYRRNVINKDLDILNFTVFHFWLDGESWMDYRRIEHLTAVKFRNGEPVEAFDTDINTKRGNPDYAPKYPNAPLFEEIAGDFDRFVGDDTLVSYYLEDKCDTLFWEGSRVMKNKGRKIDLYEEATKILELDNYRFQTIMDHYGISFAEGTAGSVVASGYLFLQMVYDKLYK